MECSHAKSLLSEYLDDTLGPRDREAVSGHLRTCAQCREELAALTSLVHELGALDPADPPRDFLLQLHDRMESGFSLKKLARMVFMPFRVKVPLQLASAVVLGGLAILVVTTQWSGKPVSGPMETLKEMPASERDDTARPLSAPREEVMKTRDLELKKEAPPLPMSRQAASPKKLRVAEPAPVAEGLTRAPIQLAVTIASGEKEKSLYHAPEQRLSAAKTAAPVPAADREVARELREERSRLGAAGRAESGVKMKTQADASPIETTRLRIETLARQMGGRTISSGGDRPDGGTRFVIVSIPAAGFSDFLDEIKRIGVLRGPPPEMPSDKDETVEVHIRLMLEP